VERVVRASEQDNKEGAHRGGRVVSPRMGDNECPTHKDWDALETRSEQVHQAS